jgi:hypothetical protein
MVRLGYSRNRNRNSRIQGLSKNAQLQATVNCSCICSLHDMMFNHQHQAIPELCVEPLWYGEQPNVKCHCQAAGFLLNIYLKISLKL